MWHDFKILLRELTTTIYGSTMQEVHNGVDNTTTPCYRQHRCACWGYTKQLIQQYTHSLETDQRIAWPQRGAKNQRHHTHEGLQPILHHLSILVAPAIKRRDNCKHKCKHTNQCGNWQISRNKSDLIWPKMALRARATIGILKEMGCSSLARLQAHSKPDDANNKKGGTSGPNDTCRKCVQIILALQHSALTDRTLQICLKEPSRLQLLNSLRLRDFPHGSDSLQQQA